jgi:triacylglycerol lipase
MVDFRSKVVYCDLANPLLEGTMSDAAQNLRTMTEQSPPIRRAAYSDRMAAMMAALSELAYTPLDEESRERYIRIAEEIAKLSNTTDIVERLLQAADMLRSPETHDNERLRKALEIGGFKLKGVMHCAQSFRRNGFFAHDTQGFVAYRDPDPETKDPGMAVVCFRGTQQLRDWLTNINADKAEVWSTKTPGKLLGHFHLGFHDAYKSVEGQMLEHLEELKELPLFVTGHSLGGALATIATWYLPGEKLAACYTFGAPRCGDDKMGPRYRTPIYRVVNGADPVPFVPPSHWFIDGLKWVTRLLPYLGWVTSKLIELQKFRHYGDQRYIPMVDQDPATGTPKRFQITNNVNAIARLARSIERFRTGGLDRPDTYHSISKYGHMLRHYSDWRQKGEV